MCCAKNIDLLGAVSMYFIHQVKKWSTSKRSSAKVEIYDINLRKNGTTSEVKMRNVSLKLISANILSIAWKNIATQFLPLHQTLLVVYFFLSFLPLLLVLGTGQASLLLFPFGWDFLCRFITATPLSRAAFINVFTNRRVVPYPHLRIFAKHDGKQTHIHH